MSEYIYYANFENDEISVQKYIVISEDSDTITTVIDKNIYTFNKLDIASSPEDAILILINSYTYKILEIEDYIKKKESQIIYLKSLIPELMFEQRKVENRKHRKKVIDKL